LPDDLGKAMSGSSSGVVQAVFAKEGAGEEEEEERGPGKGGGRRKKGGLVGETVTTKFKTQVSEQSSGASITALTYHEHPSS